MQPRRRNTEAFLSHAHQKPGEREACAVGLGRNGVCERHACADSACMDRLIGLAAIALGVFVIWNRSHTAAENIRHQNWLRAMLRMKRRYGAKEYRHNLRAAWIVGAFSILLGVYMLVSG
jgi:hypothetical protein